MGRNKKKIGLSLPPQNQAFLAQLVEQLTRNEQVVGSSPMEGSFFSFIFIRIILRCPRSKAQAGL